ncbi:MAG: hypothetical protein PSV13_15745 [Lacunisphaera sp.]|nr:hypothetical protein [Lacunisphaera sp.]
MTTNNAKPSTTPRSNVGKPSDVDDPTLTSFLRAMSPEKLSRLLRQTSPHPDPVCRWIKPANGYLELGPGMVIGSRRLFQALTALGVQPPKEPPSTVQYVLHIPIQDPEVAKSPLFRRVVARLVTLTDETAKEPQPVPVIPPTRPPDLQVVAAAVQVSSPAPPQVQAKSLATAPDVPAGTLRVAQQSLVSPAPVIESLKAAPGPTKPRLTTRMPTCEALKLKGWLRLISVVIVLAIVAGGLVWHLRAKPAMLDRLLAAATIGPEEDDFSRILPGWQRAQMVHGVEHALTPIGLGEDYQESWLLTSQGGRRLLVVGYQLPAGRDIFEKWTAFAQLSTGQTILARRAREFMWLEQGVVIRSKIEGIIEIEDAQLPRVP